MSDTPTPYDRYREADRKLTEAIRDGKSVETQNGLSERLETARQEWQQWEKENTPTPATEPTAEEKIARKLIEQIILAFDNNPSHLCNKIAIGVAKKFLSDVRNAARAEAYAAGFASGQARMQEDAANACAKVNQEIQAELIFAGGNLLKNLRAQSNTAYQCEEVIRALPPLQEPAAALRAREGKE